MNPTLPTRTDHLLGLLLGCAYVALLLATAPELGMARDEAIYVHAAESYAGFYEALFADPQTALQPETITRHFRINREHPGLIKTLFGFGYLAHKHLGLFNTPSNAYRFFGMVSAGLLLWLLLITGIRYGGRRVGVMAALLYALLPRPFYHAHLAAFDVPITLMVGVTTYAYGRSLRSPRWALYCGLLFGLALSTKHNSWVLPGLFLIHFIYLQVAAKLAGRRPLCRVPWFLPAMLLLGPPVLVGTWPWLWHDGAERFLWYAKFHLQHEYYNMAYFGRNYFWPPFPFSFPWVMTAYTVPVTTLALALLGIAAAATRELSKLRALGASVAVPETDDEHIEVLWLGALLAPLLIIALPSTPIFGGTKHWMTAYPFMCLFAGMGFCLCVQGTLQLLSRSSGTQRSLASLLLSIVTVAPAVAETVHSHPFALSHYGVLAGGVPGAADRGMNRQFWGFTTGSLADYFKRVAPDGAQLYLCDALPTSLRMLQQDGAFPPGLRAVRNLSDADFALVHHEHHFAEVDFQIWTVFGTVQPDHVLTYDGVPIISVYRNPHRPQQRGL